MFLFNIDFSVNQQVSYLSVGYFCRSRRPRNSRAPNGVCLSQRDGQRFRLCSQKCNRGGFTIYVRASSFDSNKVLLTGQYYIDNPVGLATDDVFNRRRGETVLEVSWRASAKIVQHWQVLSCRRVFTHLFCYNIGTLAFASSLIKPCFQIYIGSLKEDIFGLVFSETQYLVLFEEVYHRAHLTNVHSIASIDYQKLLVDASSRRGKDVQKADGLNNLDGIGYGCGICIESLCSFDGNLIAVNSPSLREPLANKSKNCKQYNHGRRQDYTND